MDPTLAARTLTASTEIATAALSGQDPDTVLDLVVRAAAELAEADLGLVMAGSDDGSLTVEAAFGARATNPVGLVLSARSSAARVARGGVPIVADDVTTDPRTAPYVPRELTAYGPFAAAPFGTRESRLGALTVYRRRGRKPFTSGTVEVLTAFAAQAGLVLVLAEGRNAHERVGLYEERERIARDLHDVIIQRLYGAGMQLDLLARRPARKLAKPDATRLGDAVEQLDAAIADVRSVVRALRNPDPIVPTDLAESVRAEVATARELLGFEPSFELTGDLTDIPGSLADHLRAALRESLSNVVRHAGALRVAVHLVRTPDSLRLTVADDGCGIPQGVTHRGLRNLHDRAHQINGRCDVRSSPRSGTTVTWEAPLA
ncbi:GAF domain-containing sensor histidine kinase [Actinokineospora globicatena]|uniref:GAF domain-containing sensor histidine kinase n=1 Tax=Actinokineospora globicatena TaxID=103729 RepID=UPI0020A598A6|nr:GAF domain-containing sensor histidine kinase [Actinokineospora globicatena]GLW77208.1 histidine kinase [Actinokineospora globicatena]GLW84042.1 histidine kinase [Actinokineospora globicatena]